MKILSNNLLLAVATTDAAPDTAPLLLKGSVYENLKKASDLGYSAIEIHTRENADLNLEKIKQLSMDLGVKISALVTGKLHNEEKITLIDDDPTSVTKAVEGLKKYIDLASILGTDIIIGWIRGKIPDLNSFDKYEKRFAKNIKELSSYASKKNVKIHIEAINRYEINFLNTGKEVLDFIEKYQLENVFIHLDTFHMNIEEANIYETLKICSSKLGYIHFADSNRNYPGAGHLDFQKIIDTLRQIQYKGYISVECLPNPSGEKAAEMAMKNIHRLWHE